MANTTIKITQLPSIGNGLSATTILPVVDTTGTAITAKVPVGSVGNLILTEAGNTLEPAFLSTLAYSVANAAQPNITSVGTLSVGTLKITGGDNGYILQTDGAGNLAWVAGGGSGNGEVGGANSQLQFNNAGNFGGDPELTWDAGNNKLITSNLSASGNANVGNVNTVNINATGNLRPNAIYTDNYFYANGYVFGGGGGNGTPGGANTEVQFNNNGAFAGEGNFTYDSGNHILSVTRANVSYLTAYTSIIGGNSVTANYFIGSGANLTNIAGANVGGFVPNANVANTAFAVAAANVIGLGNIATISLSGSSSNVLYGNGVFAPVTTTYGDSNVANYLPTFTGNLNGNSLTVQQDVSGNGALRLQGIANGNSTINIGGEADIDVVANVGDINLYTANNQPWIFDQDGNLTLPGNTFAVNYANGTQVNIGGGGNANTGNVTFSDQIVLGTGSNDGGGGLYLAPGNASIANSAVQYLRVRGGDYPTHIHLDTGNNEYYDQYFGADSRYVKLEANGNVVINADNYAGNGATWNFDTDGNLTLPNDANIAIYGNTTQFNTCPNGFLGLNSYDAGSNNIARVGISSADKLVGIGVSDPVTEIDYNWTFANGGGTIFPTLSTQRGDNPSGTITGQTLLFGDATQEAIISTPDGNNTDGINSQRLVINPGQGYDYGEGGDIYLWAGRGGDGSGSGGDIKIRGGQGGANTTGGIGGSGGYIRIEAGDSATTGGSPGYVDINGGNSATAGGGYVEIYGGQGATVGGDANLKGGYGYTERGGNVNIWGGGSANGQANEGNVNIQTGGHTWTYDPSGNLTLPGNTFAVNYANGTQVSIGGGGNTGNITFDNTTISTNSASSGIDVYLRGGTATGCGAIGGNSIILSGLGPYGSGSGNVEIKTGNSHTNIWTFDADGNLTFPRDGSNISTDPYLKILGGPSPQILSEDASLAGPANLAIVTDYLNLSGATGNRIILQADAGAIATDATIVLSTNLADLGNVYSWTLDTTGNLSLPEGGSIYSEGFTPSGNPGNTITLQPAGSGTITDQRLLIYPTAGDGDHIHMTSGNLYATELFLGSDNLYVKLANTGNIVINSNDGNSSNAMWTFDTDGNLTLPGNLVINGLTNVFGSNVALLQSNPDLPLLSVSSGSNGGVSSLWVEDIGNVGTSNIAAVYANPTSGSKIVRIAVGQNGGNTGPSLWDFNANGTTTFPNNTINPGNGIPIGILTISDNVYTQINQYPNNWEVYSEDDTTAANPGIAWIRADLPTVDTPQVFIENQKGSDGVPYRWTFDADGNLTIPGGGAVWTLGTGTSGLTANFADPYKVNLGLDYTTNTATLAGANSVVIQSNTGANTNQWSFNANGTTTFPGDLIGNGASPAPSISGFDSANFAGNITGGNISATGNVTAGNIYATNIVAEAPFSIQSSNFSANAGGRYGVNTSAGAVTSTLPTSPSTGGAIFFADAGGAFASNNLTINPNGQTIMGASGNMTVSTNNQSVGLFYNGTTWRIYNAG